MVRNAEIYKQALTFRKRGFTYVEIAKICGVHKATVARWCADIRTNKSIGTDNAARAAKDNAKRIALIQKARQSERQSRYQAAVTQAKTTFTHYQSQPLFTAGVTLYMAQGDMDITHPIRFTSNNMTAQRIFRDFLIKFSGVPHDTLPFWLLLYTSHDQAVCEKAWSKALKLPRAQFGKTQVLKQTSKTLHNGTGNTIIGNTVLKHTLLAWVAIAEKQL